MVEEMVIDKCCICGGEVNTLYELAFEDIIGMSHKYTQKLGICKACGYIFTQNPFSEEKLENRYKNESKFEFDSDDHFQGENEEYIKRCKRIRAFVMDCIGDVNSIFEVGAASGYNLSLYQNAMKGGVEPSKTNCRLAKKNYRIEMFNGSFREYVASGINDTYELIFLSMILEHIVNPYAFLEQLKEYNTKYMFIEVPTLDIKNTDEPFGMFCEEHVSMFTFETLNNMMRKLGYGLVDARIELGFDKGYPAGWPCIDTIWDKDREPIKYKPAINSRILIDEYIKENERALEEVKEEIDKIPDDERIAIWGTGHHVSMLLQNTSLGQKNIIRFFDSDKRKYNYKMHEKDIVEFSKERCKDIDSILIGSYIFQEQIKATINSFGIEGLNTRTLYEK